MEDMDAMPVPRVEIVEESLPIARALSPRMTWPAIKEAFPDQWVVLGELERDPVTLRLVSAVVHGHGRTSAEAEAEARPALAPGEISARRFTGRIRHPFQPVLPSFR